MVKAVIFDFDGLLADTEIISYKIYKDVSEEFHFSFSIEEYVKNYSGKTEEANVSRLIETYHLPWNVEDGLRMVWTIEEKMFGEGVELKRGAKELLSFLNDNHIKTALATSSTKDRAMKILERHNITHYFDVFVFGPELERGKPYPDIFQITCNRLHEKPEDCIVLEDSENGIRAAYSANIPVICVPDIKMPEQKYLDMTKATVDSLEDVMEYVLITSEQWE